MNTPAHIAVIMDGNGRWATERSLPRAEGHRQGAKIVERVLRHAQKRGVKIMTLFAFSSENWNRPKEEVDALISLFRSFLKNDIGKLKEEKVRVSFIGDRGKFPADLVAQMNDLEQDTKEFDQFRVVLAMSYGGRDDITRAIQKIARQAAGGFIKPEEIDVKMVDSCLSTSEIPDPDLIIRTSGEERVSNFLLWEMAYSEFYWAEAYWPDFDENELDKAIESFQKRQRRFGQVVEAK